MTTSHLKSSRRFSVFWPILRMLLTGWSPFVLVFSSLEVSLLILSGLFWVYQLQLISQWPSCSIVIFSFFYKVWIFISLFGFFQFYSACSLLLFLFCFFLLIIKRSSRLADIKWSVCISKPLRGFCVSFSRTDSTLCIYHLFIWSNYNFLHNSQWITLPT